MKTTQPAIEKTRKNPIVSPFIYVKLPFLFLEIKSTVYHAGNGCLDENFILCVRFIQCKRKHTLENCVFAEETVFSQFSSY
jgi:hypothetical protein